MSRSSLSLLSVVLLLAACGAVVPSGPTTTRTPTAGLATCEPNAPLACSTLDGIALGRFWTSVSLDTPPCDNCHDLAGTAVAALDRLAPSHPPLTAIDEFGPDPYALCGATSCIKSGGLSIFVFRFADATTLPIVVMCVGVNPCGQVDHYGPPY